MNQLKDLKVGARVKGLVADEVATIDAVTSYGGGDKEKIITFSTSMKTEKRVISEEEVKNLEFLDEEEKKEFTADPHLFELASEAYRIGLAHVFDPYFAVNSSRINPYPHQISAVYEKMLPAKPFLRFLLADDPGAGKTIMTGLLIKELIIREDLKRCLIVVPGALDKQ